jgi:SAM-dependent methyltransferase
MDDVSPLHLFTRAYWDGRYGGEHNGQGHRHVWSGRPNAQLLAHASELEPGRALEVACGEGADAIWLAQRGWAVTAVDISPAGLAKAQAHAQAAGAEVAARIQWREVDLFGEEPVELGRFDLVTSHYLHLPPSVMDRALDRLAAAVAPDGELLYVTHHPLDLEIPGLRPDVPELFHTAEELAAELDPVSWEVLETGAPAREGKGPDGVQVAIHDAVLHARRRAARSRRTQKVRPFPGRQAAALGART